MTATLPSGADDVLLRDLSDADFEAKYGCDRFTATVLSNRLSYAVQHVVTGLMHRAFSPIIALSYDFAACICAPPEKGYTMSAVTSGLSVFLGTMSDAVRVIVEEYGIDRLVPGDLLVCNDVYRIGNHPTDVCFVRPVFHDGRIAGFMALRAHQLDIGGVVPGGFSGTKKNTYENSLVISPRLIYSAGEPVKETFSLIFDNVRMGGLLLPDFKTINGCCALGDQLIQDTIETYGYDAYLGSLEYACDASAESMRSALAGIPDGDYSGSAVVDADGIDDTEQYTLNVALKKRGGELEADFSGSSRQARTSINAGSLDAKTAVVVTLKMLLDPGSDFTSGSFRGIDLVIPPGTVTSALPPDGAIFLYYEVQAAIFTAILRALEGALGADAVGGDFGSTNVHNASGLREDGTPWLCAAQAGGENGPWGGSRLGDGDGCSCNYLLNIMSPSTESMEVDFPLRIMRREFAVDTGGAGENRGGTAITRDIQYTLAAEHQTMPLRLRTPSGIGVQGGHDGGLGGVWIFGQAGAPIEGRASVVALDDEAYAAATVVAGTVDPQTQRPMLGGTYNYFAQTPVWQTEAGATWRYLTNGGGGWGDPLQRDPERVKNDVRDEYVSIEGAAREFGVVVVGDPARDPEGLVVDQDATRRLRASRRP